MILHITTCSWYCELSPYKYMFLQIAKLTSLWSVPHLWKTLPFPTIILALFPFPETGKTTFVSPLCTWVEKLYGRTRNCVEEHGRTMFLLLSWPNLKPCVVMQVPQTEEAWSFVRPLTGELSSTGIQQTLCEEKVKVLLCWAPENLVLLAYRAWSKWSWLIEFPSIFWIFFLGSTCFGPSHFCSLWSCFQNTILLIQTTLLVRCRVTHEKQATDPKVALAHQA